MRKTILFALFIFCLNNLFAQKTLVLEKLRCYSATGPIMNYFKDDTVRRTIAAQLSRTLLRFQYPPLTDTMQLPTIEYINNSTDFSPLSLSFINKDTSQLHLYIDLLETSPNTFFNYYRGNMPSDSTLLKRARSVFLLKASLFRSDKTIVFSEQLNIVVGTANSSGIGALFGTQYTTDVFGVQHTTELNKVVATPKGFTELFKTATNILFDPNNQADLVEMKILPAYFADNYILANTINRPRIYVTTVKNISTYTYNNSSEMIRMGEPVYEEILVKGKKARKYPDNISAAIQHSKNYNGSDFVFLRQECRDVVRDKNYLLTLTTQVDPAEMLPPSLVFTNFLPGNFHYLLLEKDTLARFNILKNVVDANKKIYPNKISNGNDSTSFFTLTAAHSELKVMYNYIVTGNIGARNFSINCSGFTNTIKEIFLDNKLICIAQGKFNPEKFVVFDASLSPELLNRLYMIGFNRFFE